MLVGIRHQRNVKESACCGLVVWQGGKIDGPRRKAVFPLGVMTEDVEKIERSRKTENLTDNIAISHRPAV